MTEIGTRLGGKYFVVARQERVDRGAYFEVRDARAQVFWAQWLLDAPLNASQVAQVRAELSTIPPAVSLLLPDELVTSDGGLPAAVFTSAPPKPLTSLLPQFTVGGQEPRRIAALRVLVRWIAALAEDVQRIHISRGVHGAISLDTLFAVGDGETARPILGGFGLDAAARALRNAPRPGARADLAALVLTLQTLMDRVGARPAGAALVKWDVLLNCARAGDHPALNSGSALAQTLRQLVDDEELSHRVKAAAPKSPPPSELPPMAPPETHDPVHRRRLAMIGGGALLVAAAAVAAALSRDGASGSGGARISALLSRCGDEPASAIGFDAPAEPSVVDVACRDGVTLVALARSGASLLVAERPSERGRAFTGALQTLGDAVVGTPSTLVADGAVWTAWRNASGAPFSRARLQGAAQVEPLALPGWDPAALRGAWLLRVDAGVTWIASNVTSGAAVAPTVFRVGGAEGVTAYRVGDGEILAAIAGTPATLLVRLGDDIVARSVATTTLPALASTPPDASATAARLVAASSLPASEAWHAAGRWVVAAPAGVAVPNGARHFAVTVGAGQRPPGCDDDLCAAEGEVLLLSFAERGAPAAVTITARGRATGVALGADGLILIAGVEGASARAALWSASNGAMTRAITGRHATRLAAARCGDETWVASAVTQPRPRVSLTALPCAILNEGR